MRVIATAVGFDNLCVRNPGDEFDMPDGSYGPWFEPVDEKLREKYHREAGDSPAVPAVDPTKQLADLEAANKKLAANAKLDAEPPKK